MKLLPDPRLSSVLDIVEQWIALNACVDIKVTADTNQFNNSLERASSNVQLRVGHNV